MNSTATQTATRSPNSVGESVKALVKWWGARGSNPEPTDLKTGAVPYEAVRVRPLLGLNRVRVVELVGGHPDPSVGVAAPISLDGEPWTEPTVCFSGRTYPQLARIVRVLCAVAGGCCQPVVAAVAVTVAVNRWQGATRDAGPDGRLSGLVVVRLIVSPEDAASVVPATGRKHSEDPSARSRA